MTATFYPLSFPENNNIYILITSIKFRFNTFVFFNFLKQYECLSLMRFFYLLNIYYIERDRLRIPVYRLFPVLRFKGF